MTLAVRCVLALAFLFVAADTFRAQPATQGPAGLAQLPPGISREVVHEDQRMLVAKLTLAPGARESLHSHPFDAVVVQVTAGDVEMVVGDKKTSGARPAGDVTIIGRDVPHAAHNTGKADVTVVTVALK